MALFPFHIAPGVAIKAFIPKYFSFSVFLLTQLIIDSELVYYFLQQEKPYYRYLHSFSGATIVILFCLIFGKPICQLWLKMWNKFVSDPYSRMYQNERIAYKSILLSAIVGAYSHIVIDSLLYIDMQPFYPWYSDNILAGAVNKIIIHMALIMMGTVGVFWLIVSFMAKKYHR